MTREDRTISILLLRKTFGYRFLIGSYRQSYRYIRCRRPFRRETGGDSAAISRRYRRKRASIPPQRGTIPPQGLWRNRLACRGDNTAAKGDNSAADAWAMTASIPSQGDNSAADLRARNRANRAGSQFRRSLRLRLGGKHAESLGRRGRAARLSGRFRRRRRRQG